MTTRTPGQPAFRGFRFAIAPTLLLMLAIAAIPARGQRPPQPAPAAHTTLVKRQAFEVASVRLEDPHSTVNYNDPRTNSRTTVFPANRLMMRHTYLKSLICESFAVDCGYVLGGPDWLLTQHYDLDAKVEGNTLLTFEQMRPLLQNLLEEHFHLKAHHEQKIVPGYALVIAKGGARLQPNKGAPIGGFMGGPVIKFQNMSVESFAKVITKPVNQPVIDRTGLKGTYDFDLRFAPQDLARDDPQFANLPDIFTVLQEQLGLKLVPEKVTVDTLVIDHADKVPTEN
jgi:uncharacterized protein (TIGR03435 family)